MSEQDALRALPYYPWRWQDWRSNRRVQRMSWQARGLYRELLDEFWAEGFISSDIIELAEVCGCNRDEFERFWPEILPCWEQVGTGLVNRKMEAQRTAKDAERARRAIAGRRGGTACNSLTRAENVEVPAKQEQASAEQNQASPDIGEERREEERKEEGESAPASLSPDLVFKSSKKPSAIEAMDAQKSRAGSKNSEVVLPECVPAKEWAEFLKVQRRRKTPHAQMLAIGKLTAFHAQGYDIVAILNHSIEGAYPSVYVNDGTPKKWSGQSTPASIRYSDPGAMNAR